MYFLWQFTDDKSSIHLLLIVVPEEPEWSDEFYIKRHFKDLGFIDYIYDS